MGRGEEKYKELIEEKGKSTLADLLNDLKEE
jgi:hypothetical protein